jgi:hypothetical protein
VMRGGVGAVAVRGGLGLKSGRRAAATKSLARDWVHYDTGADW